MTWHQFLKITDRVFLVPFIVWAALAITPLSWWGFVPHSVYVADTTTTEPAKVGFDREIWRPIRMNYSVTVRRVAGYQVACEAVSGVKTYHPQSTVPDDIDLVWWAPQDSRCGTLYPPGSYVVNTCWTASDLLFGFLPAKTSCVRSNVFQVKDVSTPHE